MNIYKQSLNQCFTNVVCKVLVSILTTVSVNVLAMAPSSEQKLEFETYIAPIYEQTAQLRGRDWFGFHRNNSYIRTEILGYTVPKKLVGNEHSFVAHGILSQRISMESPSYQRIIYRFTGDGSYWVVVTPVGKAQPRIVSSIEYLTDYASNFTAFVIETVGGNAIRRWKSAIRGHPIPWADLSKPSLQEALDAYKDSVFLNPLVGGPLDIEAGDPSLKSKAPLILDEIVFDQLDLIDSEVETALRRTMYLNKQIQLRSDPNIHSTYFDILKQVRKEVFSMHPVVLNAKYGQLSDSLPRGGDYDFPPGCPVD